MTLGWFHKERKKPAPGNGSPRAFGAGPYEWQPSRTVEPFYALENRDSAEFDEFMRRADLTVEWNRSEAYAPNPGEPRLDKVEADFWWWARVGEELWVLAQEVWAYFPDPLPYSLSIRSSTDGRFRNLGHFALLPLHWTNSPQKVQS
ncbi:MAG TPA: hypothetical protein VD906_11370 [Caulobacteraceae bacterium]|nr:hypothetical protein [Caulobacteraceae bacterium]